MKNIILLTLFSSLFILQSCKKDDDDDNNNNTYTCTGCVGSPNALAANDNSSAGVYKGVMLGSTGTISISLFNGGTDITATVVFDGKTGTFTTTDLAGWTPGTAISNATFTGTIDGQTVTALFSVDANGQNPQVSVNIPGHTVIVKAYKEFSTALVKSYEGTYIGDDTGGLNIVMRGNDFIVIIPGGVLVETTLVNGKVDFFSQSTTVKGDFTTTDLLEGTWNNTSSNESGTWEAKRTL